MTFSGLREDSALGTAENRLEAPAKCSTTYICRGSSQPRAHPSLLHGFFCPESLAALLPRLLPRSREHWGSPWTHTRTSPSEAAARPSPTVHILAFRHLSPRSIPGTLPGQGQVFSCNNSTSLGARAPQPNLLSKVNPTEAHICNSARQSLASWSLAGLAEQGRSPE